MTVVTGVFFSIFLISNFGDFFWISKISQFYTRKKIPNFSKFLAQKISKLQHKKNKIYKIKIYKIKNKFKFIKIKKKLANSVKCPNYTW
jgi:hypothetical protein